MKLLMNLFLKVIAVFVLIWCGLRPYSKGDNHYPSYEVITVGPVTEIIEHRAMEPVFYITDDRTVREWLGVK